MKTRIDCSIVVLLLVVCAASIVSQAQAVDRTQLEKEIDELWEQIRDRQNLLLEVSGEDKDKYSEFLRQPDTGLIRLLPRERYDAKRKLPINGGGAYYSFALLKHESGRGYDISLEQNYFSVGFAGYDFGFIVTLENLHLEELTLEHPVARSMAEYNPPIKEHEIRAEYRKTWEGLKVGEMTAKKRVQVNPSNTYLLRSFNFDETDVLVAFRIVRQDQDGSVILLWKMLKKFPAPKSIRDPLN
ncbi:MAG: hypothetical protein L0226_01270 [Acidobacteria bacterium]|nr:hypothetical protein [Acidobacteriota bacterium]